MSMMTSGSSMLMASPMVSLLRTTPGPLVVVTPRFPPKAAPSAAPTPAISSSACMVRTPKFLCFDSSCRMSDAGVMGYEPRKIGSLANCPAATSPHATAVLPLMLV
jgi:hypothetical protein